MITSTFKTFEVSAMRVTEWKNGKPVGGLIGSTTFEGKTPNLTKARAKLREAGIEIRRGDTIEVKEISKRIIAVSEEDFLRMGVEVTREEQQG